MTEENHWLIPVFSTVALILTVAALLDSILNDLVFSLILATDLFVLLLTLLLYGRPSESSQWILDHVDVSPSKGYLWFDTGETPDPEDIDNSESVLKSYPTGAILIALFIHGLFIRYSLSGAEFSPQVYGLIYDVAGGWVLVAERIRSGPYLTANPKGNARGYLESIWGFGLLGIGFLLQIAATSL